MVLAMASFAWPSVMVLKGSRLLGKTILKCSWDEKLCFGERLATEYPHFIHPGEARYGV